MYLVSSAAQYTVLFTPWALFYLCGWGGLFPCCFPSDSLADTCEGEASGRLMLQDNSRHTAVACGALHEHVALSSIFLISHIAWHQHSRLIRNSERYTHTLFVLQTASQVLRNLWNTQTLEWDHLNNDLRVRISLCSCAVQRYVQICLGCLSGRGLVWGAFQHIGAHAAIEIKWPYLFLFGIDDPGNASLQSNCNQCLFTDSP